MFLRNLQFNNNINLSNKNSYLNFHSPGESNFINNINQQKFSYNNYFYNNYDFHSLKPTSNILSNNFETKLKNDFDSGFNNNLDKKIIINPEEKKFKNKIYEHKINYNSIPELKEKKISYFKDNIKDNKDNKNDKELRQNNNNLFLKSLENLSMPLEKLLCKSKGIIEIQNKIEKYGDEYKIFICDYLNKERLPIIMKNIYGNYFFQSLIKKANKDLISRILIYISNDFVDICKDSSGTFSIQGLLDEINLLEEQKAILNFIEGRELEMVFDKNATHVLRKIILIIPDFLRININNLIIKNFLRFCLDSNGICIIRNYIKTNTIIKEREVIIKITSENLTQIAEDSFGNYCIQFILENWSNYNLFPIKLKIFEVYERLSFQRYSSNVIEKAIEVFDDMCRTCLIKKICFDIKLIFELMNNKFGKFVLNKAINYMNDDLKNEFYMYLNNYLNNNLQSGQEKKIIKKILMKLDIKCIKIDKSCFVNDRFFKQDD